MNTRRFATRPVVSMSALVLSVFFAGPAAAADGCSAPSFAAASLYQAGQLPVFVTLGDFNGDGKSDLVVANRGQYDSVTRTYTNASVSLLLAGSGGVFQTAVNYATGPGASSVVAGDFNGDSKPDLVVANYDDSSLSLLIGKGDGTFEAAVTFPAGSNPASVVASDFNGDRKLDLAVAYAGGVSVLLGNGDGTFQTARNYGTGAPALFVAASDLNVDGAPDLIVVNNGNVSVLLGSGDGSFGAPVNYGAGYDPQWVVVGDFNGDSRPDLAVANRGRFGLGGQVCCSSVSVLLGMGDGTFQPAVNYYVGVGILEQSGMLPRSLATADLNNDGALDLVAADEGYQGGVSGSPSGFSVLFGNGDGTFQPAIHHTTFGIYMTSVAVGDFNGDGQPDVACTVHSVSVDGGSVWVHFAKADGSFPVAAAYAGNGPVMMSDLNGDGKLDMVASASVLLGNGDGTFRAGKELERGFVAMRDFNGDGKPDGVELNPYDPRFSPGSVRIFLGKGDGTFQANEKSYVVGIDPAALVVSDFNRDNKADLAVANRGRYVCCPQNYTNSTISVLLGNGDGTFGEALGFDPGVTPLSMAVGDFNGDGKPDLVVGKSGSTNVVALLGKGDGTFEAPVAYETGLGPLSLAVGDFNGDRKLDLAVANAGSPRTGSVSVLLGNGDGTFQSRVNYATGTDPRWIATGDFNGDGKPDLAVANNGSYSLAWDYDNVLVLLGNGDGTFQPPIAFVAGINCNFVSVGDLNGDGKADLTVAGSSVAVLMNTCGSAGFDLTIGRRAAGWALSWPMASSGFVLETATNLTHWQPLVEAPKTNNGRLELTIQVDRSERYFRLHKP